MGYAHEEKIAFSIIIGNEQIHEREKEKEVAEHAQVFRSRGKQRVLHRVAQRSGKADVKVCSFYLKGRWKNL